ncbi:MAG: invasion associated locus B family protein [Hyphomicrobiales bacterium]
MSCVTNESTKAKTCSARLQFVNKEQRKPILAWFIGFNRDKVLMTELVTPTDVFIAPGVQVVLDEDKDNPIKLYYSACSVRGCQSSIPMTKEVRARLVKAKKVSVAIAAINGKTFNFNIEFAGFDKALADLLK